VLTVISVVPALTATTFPLVSTVAMVESLDDHVTFLFVAFAGKIVAARVSVDPTTSDNVVLLSVTLVGLITPPLLPILACR
jgi:multisubunit Na+/H+ antiporter MnhF subunit